MEEIILTNTDIDVCSEGCCNEEVIILEIAGKKFIYNCDFIYEKDKIYQYETIIKNILESLNIQFQINIIID